LREAEAAPSDGDTEDEIVQVAGIAVADQRAAELLAERFDVAIRGSTFHACFILTLPKLVGLSCVGLEPKRRQSCRN
jgi:hypothetical protein